MDNPKFQRTDRMWRMDDSHVTLIVVKDMTDEGFNVRSQFAKTTCDVWLSNDEMKSLYEHLGKLLKVT